MRQFNPAPALLASAICMAASAADVGTPAGSGASRGATNSACPGTQQHRELFIPAGYHQPFFKSAERASKVRVEPFCLGASPVTHGEFLAFVREHPEWRKSQVKALFAEESYLAEWHGDLEPRSDTLAEPVTFVSWFAAGAYCEAQGGRLPTVAEWERVAGTAPAKSEGARPVPQASRTPAGAPFSFAMGRRPRGFAGEELAFPGVWEWTANFNSALVSGRIGTAEGADASLFCGDGFRAVDATDYAAFLRYSFRSSLKANFALKNLGFRCARDPR
jgi:formylglycine-generating enzyme